MSARIMIVEDEFLVAVNLQAVIEDLGHTAVGIAADRQGALDLAEAEPDVALVDINLRDGPTGVAIGTALSQRGISVLYVTANPRMLGDGVPGTLGVMTKPCDIKAMEQGIRYAVGQRHGRPTPTPPGFIPFAPSAAH